MSREPSFEFDYNPRCYGQLLGLFAREDPIRSVMRRVISFLHQHPGRGFSSFAVAEATGLSPTDVIEAMGLLKDERRVRAEKQLWWLA